jgi:hypothetical protein
MIKTKISFSENYPFTKPTQEQLIKDNQLFSRDTSTKSGAKMFLIKSYQEIYDIIKTDKIKCYYEDHTYNNKIKLHIDIDINYEYNDCIDRDIQIDLILDNLLPLLNTKIKKNFNIDEPEIIILISNTLLKLSIHIIYVNVIFEDIYSMGYFLVDYYNIIDKNIYKKGCFRMLYCNKIGKFNTLIFYKSYNYNYNYNNDYQLFIDSCLCSNTKSNIVDYKFDKINKKSCGYIKQTIHTNYQQNITNYKYTKPNFNIIKKALETVSLNDYDDWFHITCAIKNLYLGLDNDDALELYKIYNNVCSSYSNYNEDYNLNTFDNIEPTISINYLFYTANIKYYIKPIYDYKSFMFNPNNHKNIIIDNSININININKLVKYKLICLKSPTGTGKTKYLKDLISHLKIKNIISIVSRVNLAGEHQKSINLQFYKELDYNDYNYCNKLVIQLESLSKCNYKLYENGILILDEINSLLSHLRSPTMNNRRAICYKYLITLIKNAKYIIAMDADLCDWNIDFIKEIQQMDYIVYYNTIKNKLKIPATFYFNDKILINQMIDDIKANKFFVACFDSLKWMMRIIEYIKEKLSGFDPLVYSSKVKYDLIDTKTWDDRFVFYTPTIIYGISYENFNRDVYCFIYKNHLNPLQIYQMINRVRCLNNAYIYCNEKTSKIIYDDIHMIKKEEDYKIKTFNTLFENINLGINEKPYNIMYHNYKFIDLILKTNIKYYLIDMLIEKGFNIRYNNIIKNKDIKIKTVIDKTDIVNKLLEILNLDKDNLDDFHRKLVTNDGNVFEKHINMRIWLDANTINDKIISNIQTNLFSETLNSRFLKLKYCSELGKILNIFSFENLTKDISKYFSTIVDNKWLADNLISIIKTFRLSEIKYNTNEYYKLYQMYISMMTILFDKNLIDSKRVRIYGKDYIYYIINNIIYEKHMNIINKVKTKNLFNCDFIN